MTLPEADSAVPADPGVRGPRRACRALIIEDSVDTAELLRLVVELEGWDVDVAHDGLEGVEKAQVFEPDVVLCDLGLPLMDGYAVARTIRADHAMCSIYLIALTGWSTPEHLAEARRAGFDFSLVKPPRIDEIRDVLRRLQLHAA